MIYAIKNIKILNGHEDMTPVEGKAIIVDDGKIADIISENEIPGDIEIRDLGGRYLLPGLINLHVHIAANGKPKNKKTDYKKVAKLLKLAVARFVVRKMCEKYVLEQLLSGTTTVRTVGGVLDFDSKVRDRINSGKIKGPRILASDYAVSVEGGHMTGSVAMPAHSPEEAVQMVRDIAKLKPDLIKLMITGGVLDATVPGEPGVLKMPAEYVKAAVEEAHKLGYKVAAHVEGTEGMIVALNNGVDSIEHGGKPDDEVIKLFKEKGSVLVGTLSPAVPFVFINKEYTGLSDIDVLNGKALFENMKECINECLKNGITVGLGTDSGCPFTTQYDFWRELVYYNKFCGVSPAFAIHTATEINASVIGIDDITGTVEKGKSADFMVVRDNPLNDLQTLRSPTEVFIRGDMIVDPKPKKFSLVEEQLDNVLKL